jgi:hypothetical protein
MQSLRSLLVIANLEGHCSQISCFPIPQCLPHKARLLNAQCTRQHLRHYHSPLDALRMLCTTQTQMSATRLLHSTRIMDVRYKCIVAWTQVLPLVPTLTHNGAIPRERKHDSILLAMMMNRGSSVWFGNHSRGANVWSQADQRIRSLHALCLPTRNLERRALLHDDWLLFLHI